MGKLARRAFTFCAAFSLLLCAAAVVLWIRGTQTVDRVSLATALGRYFELASDGGGLALTVADGWPQPQAERWTSGDGATAATFATGTKVAYELGVLEASAEMRRAAESLGAEGEPLVDRYRMDARERHKRALSDFRASVAASRVGPGVSAGPASLSWETWGWGIHAGRGRAALLRGDPASADAGQQADWVLVELRFLRVRYAALVVPTAVLPMLWLTGRVRSHYRAWDRRRRSLCVACGYDLRASTGRCPECGASREGNADAMAADVP